MSDSLKGSSCRWNCTIQGEGAKVGERVVVNQPSRSRVGWVSLTVRWGGWFVSGVFVGGEGGTDRA